MRQKRKCFVIFPLEWRNPECYTEFTYDEKGSIVMNENRNRKKQPPRRKTFLETFFGDGTTVAVLAKRYGVPVLLAVYALIAVFAMPRCTLLKDAPSEDASFKMPSVTKEAPKAAATPAPTPTPEPKEPTFTNATLAYAGDLVVP